MAESLSGKLAGNRGNLSQPFFEQFYAQGVQWITPLRKYMGYRLGPLRDKLLTRKRSTNENIVDQHKNISQIDHTTAAAPDFLSISTPA